METIHLYALHDKMCLYSLYISRPCSHDNLISNIGARAVRFADFGEGEGPIFLDNVQCNGAERFLNECSSNALGTHNCGHHKDAGVICRGMGLGANIICTQG